MAQQYVLTFEEAHNSGFLPVDVCDTQSEAAHHLALLKLHAGINWHYVQAERRPPLGKGKDHAIYARQETA